MTNPIDDYGPEMMKALERGKVVAASYAGAMFEQMSRTNRLTVSQMMAGGTLIILARGIPADILVNMIGLNKPLDVGELFDRIEKDLPLNKAAVEAEMREFQARGAPKRRT